MINNNGNGAKTKIVLMNGKIYETDLNFSSLQALLKNGNMILTTTKSFQTDQTSRKTQNLAF